MAPFRPVVEFTAQSATMLALIRMYARFESDAEDDHHVLPIVVFMAFTVEAYLNSVGSRHVASWTELERLGWRQKILILHTAARKQADWGRDPLQFAAEAFRFRDKLAHGKAEEVIGPRFDSEADAHEYLKRHDLVPSWYAKLTREWVLSARPRHQQLLQYIGQLFGLHESDHSMRSRGGVFERE